MEGGMWRTWWLVEFLEVSAHVGNHAFCLGTANNSLQHHYYSDSIFPFSRSRSGKTQLHINSVIGGVPNHFPYEGVVVIQENPRNRWMIRKFLGPPRWCAAMFDEFGFSWCWHSWCFHTTMMISSPHGFLVNFLELKLYLKNDGQQPKSDPKWKERLFQIEKALSPCSASPWWSCQRAHVPRRLGSGLMANDSV